MVFAFLDRKFMHNPLYGACVLWIFFEAWLYGWRKYFFNNFWKPVVKLENFVFLWEKSGLKRQFN